MKKDTIDQIELWLDRIDKSKPPAIVMGGSVNGLSFVRSLGRKKIPTLLIDIDRSVGTYSRYPLPVLMPDPQTDPGPLLETLEFIGTRIQLPGILFSTSDVHCLFIARHSEALARHYRFLTPDIDTLEQIVDKRLQYTIAERAGIPIPKTSFPESSDQVISLAKDFSYPCILKSYKSFLGTKKIAKKALVVDSAEDLISSFAEITTDEIKFMIQEIIPGEDSALFGYLAFWDKDAREHSWLTKQKLRQNPPHYGDGSLQITVEAPEVRELSCKLLEAFSYKGFVGVEFKFDSRDHMHKLMEINPRTVSGNQLAISAGIDFPWIGYEYLSGLETDQASRSSFMPNVKYINEEWDFKAYLALRKTGKLTFKSWFQSIRGAKARSIGAWDDPYPLFVIVLRIMRAFIRGIWPGKK